MNAVKERFIIPTHTKGQGISNSSLASDGNSQTLWRLETFRELPWYKRHYKCSEMVLVLNTGGVKFCEPQTKDEKRRIMSMVVR